MEFMSVDVDFCGFSFFFLFTWRRLWCIWFLVNVSTCVQLPLRPLWCSQSARTASHLTPSSSLPISPLSARNDVIVQWWSTNQTLAFSLPRAELGLFLWLLYFVAPTSCVCAAVPGEQLDGLRPDPQVFIQGPGALFLLGPLAENQLLPLLHKTIIKSE